MIKWPEIYNFELLNQEYIKNQKSVSEIANQFKCTRRVVYLALKKFNIPRRNACESHLKHDDYGLNIDYDVFNGSLLGDASLKLTNKKGLGTPQFVKANINYDHICFIASKIYPDKYIDRIDTYKINSEYNHPIFRFKTYNHTILTTEYKRWYPEHIKIVPKDLILTPGVLLHWFMDDGSCVLDKGVKNNGNNFNIRLHSQSFTKEDNEFLCDLIYKLGISCTIQKVPLKLKIGYIIHILRKDNLLFFNTIGKCPVNSLQYKWIRRK